MSDYRPSAIETITTDKKQLTFRTTGDRAIRQRSPAQFHTFIRSHVHALQCATALLSPMIEVGSELQCSVSAMPI